LALAEALADEAGGAAGRLEKALREENTALRKELESLRGEVTLLRASANRPAKASIKPRAPFALSDGDVLRN